MRSATFFPLAALEMAMQVSAHGLTSSAGSMGDFLPCVLGVLPVASVVAWRLSERIAGLTIPACRSLT